MSQMSADSELDQSAPKTICAHLRHLRTNDNQAGGPANLVERSLLLLRLAVVTSSPADRSTDRWPRFAAGDDRLSLSDVTVESPTCENLRLVQKIWGYSETNPTVFSVRTR